MKGRNMTRWRDPAKDPRQEPKSNLITAEGAARLRGILDHLSRVKRPELSAKVGEAAALGDRSENADKTFKTLTDVAYPSLRSPSPTGCLTRGRQRRTKSGFRGASHLRR